MFSKLATWTITLILTLFMVYSPANAATWGQIRDRIMTLRETGRATEAYALVLATKPGGAADLTDRNFLAGFISLRYLSSPETALNHFREMAVSTGSISLPRIQREAKAKAGFWLAETLVTMGKTDQSQQLYTASANFRDTFYGMIAASKIGLKDSSSVLKAYSGNYPRPQLYWYDNRIKQELVLAVVKAESSFKPTAVSGAGAKGLMQLMDGTATAVGKRAGVAIDLALVARDGNYNIAVGSKHLADLMDRYSHNIVLASAAYNAGESRVDEWIRRFGDPRVNVAAVEWAEMIPFKETRDYVQKVGSNYLSYLALSQL